MKKSKDVQQFIAAQQNSIKMLLVPAIFFFVVGICIFILGTYISDVALVKQGGLLVSSFSSIAHIHFIIRRYNQKIALKVLKFRLESIESATSAVSDDEKKEVEELFYAYLKKHLRL